MLKTFTEEKSGNDIICKTIRGYTNFLINLDKDKNFFQKNVLFYSLYRDIYSKRAAVLSSIIALSGLFGLATIKAVDFLLKAT